LLRCTGRVKLQPIMTQQYTRVDFVRRHTDMLPVPSIVRSGKPSLVGKDT